MVLLWTYGINLIRKLIRHIILDKIKSMLFSGTFYCGLLKILLQNFFFIYKKALLQIIFLCHFLRYRVNEKWTNSYQKHTHKILLMQLNLLLAIRWEKNGMEK